MTLSEAKELLNHMLAKRRQWGKHYSPATDSEYRMEVFLEAADTVMAEVNYLAEHGEDKALEKTKELRAAKAREGKLKKQIEGLNKKLVECSGIISDFETKIDVLEAKVKTLA